VQRAVRDTWNAMRIRLYRLGATVRPDGDVLQVRIAIQNRH
jgi:hypothetical protein